MTFTFEDFLVSRRYTRDAVRVGRKYTRIIFEAGYTEEDIMRLDGHAFRDIMYHGPDLSTNPWSRAIGMYRSFMRERDEKKNQNQEVV